MKKNTFDVIIIGGGFAGCALAYHFAKARISTILLESKHVCSGTSSACAGRVQIFDSETPEYLKIVQQGYSELPFLGDELEIDLEWNLPDDLTLFYSEEQLASHLEKIAWMKDLGLNAEFVKPEKIKEIEPCLNSGNCVGAILAEEGHLNPFKFGWGYLKSAKKLGAVIKCFSNVEHFIIEDNKIVGVKTSTQSYFGKYIILATGAWTGFLTQKIGVQLPISFTKAEAMVSEPLPKIIHHHLGTNGFYDSVHGEIKTVTLGLGQHNNGCLLISNAIQPANKIERTSSAWGMPAINQKMREFFPTLNNIRIMRTWSAPSPFSKDYQPIIGWLPQFANLYIASAFHLAIPTIPVFSKQIVDHVLSQNHNVASDFLEPYSPKRFFK
ncbi:MAG: FAD-binding oxidoreductase [Anaerolineaceae bacterium]|nr:FAD-binding oxidoreductase [Anaerolineaceae bacterium]